MHYTWDIIIPANTPDSSPTKQHLILTVGIVKHIDIKFPAGCHGMVKIRLKRWNFQLVPLSSDEYVTGDDETIPIETYYEMLEVPTFFVFEGSSPNTTYQHKITIRIDVEPVLTDAEIQIIELLKQLTEALNPNEQ